MVTVMMPKSVLLVEDNIDDEFIARRILRKAGISAIEVAGDGQKALDLLFAPGAILPELVILDLRLPKISGLDIFAELRRQKRTISLPVLVLTSSDDPKDREVCIKLGAVDYLIKPIELGDLQRLFS